MSSDGDSVLAGLLDAELGADPTTVDHLTNHLPMALVAKARLGADATELRRFAAAYSERLVPLAAPEGRLDATTWMSSIGRSGAAGELRRYFGRAIADQGVDDVLRTHLPALVPGLGAAAFHGAIRLAYALEVDSPIRVAAGLAYLAEVAAPLGPMRPGPGTTTDPVELLSELSSTGTWGQEHGGSSIGRRMRAIAGDERFATVPSSLLIDERTEGLLADAALRLFATTGDFTSLHGVTGLAAISALRPWIDTPTLVDQVCFQALAAAYLSLGAPPLWSDDRLDDFVASDTVDPAAVAQVAAWNDDEHVSKLVYTAHTRWRQTGDPLYRAVAAREAGLPAPVADLPS